jgi:hypothetical protein
MRLFCATIGLAAASAPLASASESGRGRYPMLWVLLGHEYFVSGIAAASTGGHDDIVRAATALTVRIYRQPAVALKHVWSRRNRR